MHACGHDMHATALLAALGMLLEAASSWQGTVIACFQPCEENGRGAQAMIDDGLYGEKWGVPTWVPPCMAQASTQKAMPALTPGSPDYLFASHVVPGLAGTLSLTRGTAFTESRSWKVTIRGVGGHASSPETCVDPIVAAAFAIARLQTVVSRRVGQGERAVLTVGEIHGGNAENAIPSECWFTVNTRAGTRELSARLEREMRNIVTREVQASDPAASPDGPEPNPRFEPTSHLPLVANDGALADDLAATFAGVFGDAFHDRVPPGSASEDFSNLAKSSRAQAVPDLPYCYWRFGATPRAQWEEAGGDVARLPSNHNSRFLPQLDLADEDDPLKVGASALFLAALSKLWKGPLVAS